MKKLIILSISICFSVITFAETINKEFNFKNYDEAVKGKSFVKFDMKSTKLGFITTSFDGYLKKFTLGYDHINSTINNVEMSFPVLEMDTDSGSRNEKMHELCLDYKKHPEIKIKLLSPLKNENNQTIPAIIILKNKEYKIFLNTNITNANDKIIITGKAKLSIKSLKIPDPSIIIASVKDDIFVSFKLILPVK